MRLVGTDLSSVWGIELDLISVMGSELTWFLCRSINVDLNLEWVSKLT